VIDLLPSGEVGTLSGNRALVTLRAVKKGEVIEIGRIGLSERTSNWLNRSIWDIVRFTSPGFALRNGHAGARCLASGSCSPPLSCHSLILNQPMSCYQLETLSFIDHHNHQNMKAQNQ